MNFLKRFEAIEKECENKIKKINLIEEKENEENEKKQRKKTSKEHLKEHSKEHLNEEIKEDFKEDLNEEKEEDNNNWINKNNLENKLKDKIKLNITQIKNIPLNNLIWTTLTSIRGGSSYVFGRICNISEIAHYKFHDDDLDDDGLIPSGKVIVEYFSLPINYPQYGIKDPSTLRAYNEHFRTREMGPIDRWNEQTMNYLLKTVLKRKYTSQVAQYIFDQSYAVANEFLRYYLFIVICRCYIYLFVYLL